MKSQTLKNWLILWHAPHMTAHSFHKLYEHFTDFDALFQYSQTQLEALGFKPETAKAIKSPDEAFLEAAIAWHSQENCHIACLNDPVYPFLLKEIKDAPPILFINGDPSLLSHPQIAIVGSRNASPTGKEIAAQFASQLVCAGFHITSGLALGIDAASHLAALEQGGKTIAVVGTGIDRIYPHQNKPLAERIIKEGVIVSDFPLGMPPKRENFPQRNRIVSGLSLGTLVVEAGFRSGSLITARLAAEQGREVFAIPSSIRHPQGQGCHALIHQGAKLVTHIDDILEELNWTPIPSAPQETTNYEINRPDTLDRGHQKLLQCVGFEATPVDVLCQRSGLSVAEVAKLLCELELQGKVHLTQGGYLKSHI